jgi:MFS family permease
MNDLAYTHKKAATLLLIVSALGYFVDVYDLIIFSVVRTPSLISLGVSGQGLLSKGLLLLNIQLAGVLVGGLIWGVLGDKLGRLSVLFGSITIYSAANLLNAQVSTIWQYEILRFVSGLGLAGELGAGITIVSEVLPAKVRGYGTMLIASIGLLGAVVASECGIHFSWRMSYLIGGVMGLGLLVLRIGVSESPLFKSLMLMPAERGNVFMLFNKRERAFRYIKCILAGLPLYFVVGILITASPEIGKSLGLAQAPSAAVAVMVCYAAMSVGDVLCSSLSQFVHSRRYAIITFNMLTGIAIAAYLFLPSGTLSEFYWRCAFLGFGTGFWATVITNAAEHFGTNLRATVATTVPNLIRGMLIPITFIFDPLKARIGLPASSAIIGLSCVGIAITASLRMSETFGKDLNFIEE